VPIPDVEEKLNKRIPVPAVSPIPYRLATIRRLFVWAILLSPVLWASRAESNIGATSSGSWSPRIGIFNTVSGPGSDLVSSYECGATAFHLSVMGSTDSLDTWRIDVSRTYTSWPQAVKLFVRRIDGSGAGSGAITSGGTLYQEVGAMPSAFCSGRGDISNVSLMYKISGISLHVTPGVYSTSVVFTVVDL
jgi:hypothetical protein